MLAAKQPGAEHIIAMSRHEPRQKLALEFGATDIVTERGDEGVAKIKHLTGGLGARRSSGGSELFSAGPGGPRRGLGVAAVQRDGGAGKGRPPAPH